MENHLRKIVELSLGSTPEDMLKASLDACIDLAGANGGSILAEEGPALQFLFSNVTELIGTRVPFDSLAGHTVRQGLVIYTYAPKDTRHFDAVDAEISHTTKYLLSIPIPTVHTSSSGTRAQSCSGALQLLFEENIFPTIDVEQGPQEFSVADFKESELYEQKLKNIFWILPIVAFGMEIVSMRQTSYQVIHELKNKMISGLSWINYLKEDVQAKAGDLLEDESIKEDFELAESSVRDGSELAKKYPQFTKIFTPNFEQACINDLLKETAASVTAFAQEQNAKGFEVKTDLDESVGERELDIGQLRMAFFNLCKNGAEALIEFKTENPTMTISSAKRDDHIEIVVSDNGPGMPPEIADNLFIAFKTKKEGGTGLGLTIVKKIIDTHGGTISCDTDNNGTTFTVLI
jgi:signal transduction histidine kinase